MATGETITKTVRMYDKQRDFLHSKALFRGFAAGIGSGKSFIGAYDMIRRAKANRLYMVTAPTYTLMADASFRSMEGIARDLDFIADIARGSMPYIKLKTGAEILFRSTHEPDMLRGPNLSGVWMDEASLMKAEAFDILIGRLREGGELGWLTATFTPKGRSHWTYKQFATGQPDTEMFHASTDENPFLAEGFYETRKKQYTQKQIDQELGGIFLDGGGNHFCPGAWPKFGDIGDAFSIQVSATQRRVYHRSECTILLGLDWALNKVDRKRFRESTDDKTDFNAFVVGALTTDGNLFILDCVNERIPMEGKAPKLAELCRCWRPHIVSADDDMLSETLKLDCRRYRDIPEIRLLPISGKNKVARATAAIIRGENGLIFLPQMKNGKKEESWLETFIDCLSSFNGVDDEHDDVPDALGIVGRLADELKGDGREESMPDIMTPARDLFGFGNMQY